MATPWCWLLLASVLTAFALGESVDGGPAPRLQLNDGSAMPVIGLGTFLGFDENGQKEAGETEVEDAVAWALDAGYRMIDTAAAYRNEEQVGRGLRRAGIPRNHVYLVTKLDSHEQRRPVSALRDSLRRLNVSQVDLFLIHNPVAFKEDGSFDVVDYLDTWKGMEEGQKLGLVQSIGVSNFNVSQLERLLAHCEVKPAVLQVEVNLNLAQEELIEFCKQHEIAVMAYTPFGSLFESPTSAAPPPRVDDPLLQRIAKKYSKTVPQVVLRYLIQRGVAPIPKSVRRARILENLDVFDFQLTKRDMAALAEFNKNYRVVHPSVWQDHPYYPFERVASPGPDPFKGKKEKN